MSNWQYALDPPFSFDPALQAPREAAWRHLQRELPLGSVLTGAVFARAEFGVFYDAGVGFPVLMKVVEFLLPPGSHADAPGISSRAADGYPTLGSLVSGRLLQFGPHQQLIVACLP